MKTDTLNLTSKPVIDSDPDPYPYDSLVDNFLMCPKQSQR